MNIILTAILIISLFQLIISIALCVKGIETYRKAKNLFVGQDDKPSQFGIIVDGIGDSIAAKIKTAAMGVLSGKSRMEQAVQGELIEQGLNAQNPFLSGLLNQFPKLRKLVTKNPELAQFAVDKLAGLGKAGGPSGPAGSAAGDNHSGYNPNKYGG